MIVTHDFCIETSGRGFTEITQAVDSVISDSDLTVGLCSVFVNHTSASLLICENADAAVLTDLESYMQGLVVDGDPNFRHVAEGPDDMAAHIRSVLTQSEISVPIRAGQLATGTWQGIYLWEHRTRPHRRRISLTLYG